MRIVDKDRNRQRKVLVTETMSAASVPFVAGPASEWRRGEHASHAGISPSTFGKPSSHVYQADAEGWREICTGGESWRDKQRLTGTQVHCPKFVLMAEASSSSSRSPAGSRKGDW